jgi:cellulose synthase/poly-beta-1,6-N-acetylglucosamine synthase-like glycosyltransferase
MMEVLLKISLVILLVYILIQALNIFSLLYVDNDQSDKILSDEELPSISILIAARNEEQTIIRCLKSIAELDYPSNKIQVLVGNDDSEDNTKELIEGFIKKHQNFEMLTITNTIGKARGKANVLAQLAHQATGEFFLITDADISVGKKWAREIVSFFAHEKLGIVSGITIVEDKGMFGRMQEIDWMYFMGLLKSSANYGLNCTAVGNNMAIRKVAYWDVGGYENIDFSVTEDFKLYKEVRMRGWQTKNILNENIRNRSAAITTFKQLMHQRKRWLIGARELPFYWWLLFSVFGAFAPAIIIVFLFSVKLGLIFYFIKLALQTCSILILQNKLNVRKDLDYLLTYELYSIFISLSTIFFFLFRGKLEWKNRSYNA